MSAALPGPRARSSCSRRACHVPAVGCRGHHPLTLLFSTRPRTLRVAWLAPVSLYVRQSVREGFRKSARLACGCPCRGLPFTTAAPRFAARSHPVHNTLMFTPPLPLRLAPVPLDTTGAHTREDKGWLTDSIKKRYCICARSGRGLSLLLPLPPPTHKHALEPECWCLGVRVALAVRAKPLRPSARCLPAKRLAPAFWTCPHFFLGGFFLMHFHILIFSLPVGCC